jgi:hypothetical protein
VDLYTLSDTFLAKDPVDQFVSAIWNERYSAAADVQLVVAATGENLSLLADGTFLGLRGSKEVMQIQTQSIEKGLDDRRRLFSDRISQPAGGLVRESGLRSDQRAGQDRGLYPRRRDPRSAFIAGVVDRMCIIRCRS